MHADYHKALLSILARLDRLETETGELLAEPGDSEILPRAEELRELIVEMRAGVEAKLDRAANQLE
jgi:hypothetical protein